MARQLGLIVIALLGAMEAPVPCGAGVAIHPSVALAPAAPSGIEFLSPAPGSSQILPETNVIIRPGGTVDPASVGAGIVRVQGSASGFHEGRLRASDDLQTLVFQPDVPFAFGEQVTALVGPGLATDRGPVPPTELGFTIVGPEHATLPSLPDLMEADDELGAMAGGEGNAQVIRVDSLATPPAEPPPPDFPHIQATMFGTPAPGRIFLSNLSLSNATIPSFLMILENSGAPYFWRRLGARALDFKMQPDGRLTYFDDDVNCFYALNAAYAVVDSFRCGNGYATDGHDLVLLPNGHALIMSYDPEFVDLTSLKAGPAFGIAIGLIVQELDREKNVVFQWRSWDHFQLTDMIGRISFGGGIDYVHGNSVDADPDGNIVISCRHMNEVTKISRATGEILWRLGGKNNQFTFLNDPIPFARQHAARLLPNGHLVLFDNGNARLPLFSRAVEYALDEAQKTATLAWQYRLSPDAFGPAFGYVQRLANGNTLIGWGATTPTVTEVAPDGFLVSELTFDPGTASYRAFRFEWPPVKPAQVTFNPSTIRKGPLGGPLLAVVEPVASGFSAGDVLIPTVRLNGTVRADMAIVIQPDANGDGIPDVTVQFPRDAVDPLLLIGTNRLEVSGSLRTGEVFRGSADVRVVASDAAGAQPAPLQVVSAPGALPVEIAGSAGGEARGVRLFAIYDVQGRLVKRWRAASGPGGRVSWDGLKSDGGRAGSGIYLVRTEDGAPGPAAKILIAR